MFCRNLPAAFLTCHSPFNSTKSEKDKEGKKVNGKSKKRIEEKKKRRVKVRVREEKSKGGFTPVDW